LLAIGIGIYVLSASRRQRNISLSRLPISSVVPKSSCPFCGKPISINATFCSKCGQEIENPSKNPPKI
ncbi:MAG: zinc ribbon domain-containing protein, partial [Promethearchaeota archaeon]